MGQSGKIKFFPDQPTDPVLLRVEWQEINTLSSTLTTLIFLTKNKEKNYCIYILANNKQSLWKKINNRPTL